MHERTVPLRGALIHRREPTDLVRGRSRRAQAIAQNLPGVVVSRDGARGFTLATLKAAVADLEAQGHGLDTPLVAKVTDHPLNAEVPDAHLVAILAIVQAPEDEVTE